jgi:Protein of unknown function (DUF1488)
MFFTFPEDARWNADRQAVEFGVVIGEYEGVVRVPRRVFQRLLPERPTPERCVEAYYLQRTRFESIAERKLRRRQLTEDGNVEISGGDLRRAPGGNCAASRGASQIDPGCAKTRAFDLRVESSSQFGQSENPKCWWRLSEEGNRENGSTLSWLAHVFTRPGPIAVARLHRPRRHAMPRSCRSRTRIGVKFLGAR